MKLPNNLKTTLYPRKKYTFVYIRDIPANQQRSAHTNGDCYCPERLSECQSCGSRKCGCLCRVGLRCKVQTIIKQCKDGTTFTLI